MAKALLVTPSYRDAARLSVFGPELAKALQASSLNVQWAIADDGSGVEEEEKLEALCRDLQTIFPDVSLHVPDRHYGKGGIIKWVWNKDHGCDWVSFIDADGSVDAPTFLELLEKARALGPGHAVLASRRRSPETTVEMSALRTLSHKAFGWLARVLLKLPVEDCQCGAKIIAKSDFDRVASRLQEDGLAFDAELLSRLQETGVKLVEVPVDWFDKTGGRVNPWRDSLPMLAALARIRARTGPSEAGKAS